MRKAWRQFQSWNKGHKWNIVWKKGQKSILFNEGGWFVGVEMIFAPHFYFRLFLSAYERPMIFSFGLAPKEWKSYEEFKTMRNAA